jgi:hypothetical protein
MLARCRVSFTNTDAVAHTAHVQAESLFEAVALAVAEFRQDNLVSPPTPMTDFIVAIERPPVEHRIRLSHVIKWAESYTTREGPTKMTKRPRVKSLISGT